jgi:hypothetical protein
MITFKPIISTRNRTTALTPCDLNILYRYKNPKKPSTFTAVIRKASSRLILRLIENGGTVPAVKIKLAWSGWPAKCISQLTETTTGKANANNAIIRAKPVPFLWNNPSKKAMPSKVAII